MPASELTCPKCQFKAPPSLFENMGGGELKCRRCRSKFDDPNAYVMSVSYADCDSLRPVTRFPFSLNGNNAMIRVREGYLALVIGTGGIRLWIEEPGCHITRMPDGFQLYYVCLSPRILWGAGVEEGFGAYGTAQLSISREFAKAFCSVDSHILTLEKYLRDVVGKCVTELIRTEIQHQSVGLLEQRDEYQRQLHGTLEKGVDLTRIDPKGFKNGDETTHFFSSFIPGGEPAEAVEPAPVFKSPVEITRLPKQPYTIGEGVEEALVRGNSRVERHKAGERMDPNALHGVEKVVRYRKKEFEFPFGWGVYNLARPVSGFYSAQGTISFFVDNTESFSLLLAQTRSWQMFEDQFFTTVLKKELSAALRDVMNTRLGRQDFKEDRIDDHLSAMSVELTNLLNGEGPSARDPAFRNYGLRVKQTDILSVCFYANRR